MVDGAAFPIRVDEVAPAFERCFGRHPHVVLAVSGGSDSTALMHLAAAWRAARGAATPVLSVATVEHGLRPGSLAEAQSVGVAAAALGMAHTILEWTGEKPVTGVQAAARAARYGLLQAHLAYNGWSAVATAHTQDDQAETLLMRLARGSGLDGLSGMAERRVLDDGADLLRPLLGFSKDRLVATLRAREIAWFEDPSNEVAAFERTRLRRARSALDAVGLSAGQVATSARRLARARAAIEHAVSAAAQSAIPAALRIDPLGFAALDWAWLTSEPEEIRLRILARLIQAIGGEPLPPALSQLEAMTVGRDWQPPSGCTLAGAMFSAGPGGEILVLREFGREAGGPRGCLAPGEAFVWDRRFAVALSEAATSSLDVRALGEDGVRQLERGGAARPGRIPVRVLRTLPGFWREDTLLAAPLLGFVAAGLVAAHLSCRLAIRPFATGDDAS